MTSVSQLLIVASVSDRYPSQQMDLCQNKGTLKMDGFLLDSL